MQCLFSKCEVCVFVTTQLYLIWIYIHFVLFIDNKYQWAQHLGPFTTMDPIKLIININVWNANDMIWSYSRKSKYFQIDLFCGKMILKWGESPSFWWALCKGFDGGNVCSNSNPSVIAVIMLFFPFLRRLHFSFFHFSVSYHKEKCDIKIFTVWCLVGSRQPILSIFPLTSTSTIRIRIKYIIK